jgi:hypothetical protein
LTFKVTGDNWHRDGSGQTTDIDWDDLEVKRTKDIYVTETKVAKCLLMTFIERHSSWYRLKKSFAWLLRVKKTLQDRVLARSQGQPAVVPDKLRPLDVSELRQAEVEIIKLVQLEVFHEEIEALSKDGNSVDKSSKIADLCPHLAKNSTLCVGGRLKNSSLDNLHKHPMLLPKSHHVVSLLVHYYHILTGHSGRVQVLSHVRKKFWIINGMSAVRAELKCFECKRRKAQPMSQIMADLPSDRVTPDNPAFWFTGVDYFGPFEVKRGRSLEKRYGCIFTCMASRAIHIEIAHSLDTDSFINALFRFISRRGNPDTVRSDNGTNFVGAERELRESIKNWNQNQIADELRQREINWLFQPPLASHMSGVWERMIQSVREVLAAVAKMQTFSDEGLLTWMCQVEAIVNSRPITPVSDDPRDAEALTPNHLLLCRPNLMLPPGVFVQKDLYCR